MALLRMSGHCSGEREPGLQSTCCWKSLWPSLLSESHTSVQVWLLLWCYLLSWPPLPSCLSAFRVLLWSDCWHLGQTSYFLNYCFMGISNGFQMSHLFICYKYSKLNILKTAWDKTSVGFQNICIHTVSYVADRTTFPIENLFVLHIFYV